MPSVQIMNLTDLDDAREFRRAVYVPSSAPWRKPRPAATVLRMPAATVLSLIRAGLFTYEKKGA